jgi:hypothetical protein
MVVNLMPGSVQVLTVEAPLSVATGTGLLHTGGLGEESGVKCAELRTFRDSFLAGGVGRFRSSSVGVESAKATNLELV